jgi:hypothetical protein
VPERRKNRWIVKERRAKKATGEGAFEYERREGNAISWNDKVNCGEEAGEG